MSLEYIKEKLEEIATAITKGEINNALWLNGKCIGYIDNEISKALLETNKEEEEIIKIDTKHSEKLEETDSIPDEDSDLKHKEKLEKQRILEVLIIFKGKRKESAEYLGISERAFYRKMNKYKIKKDYGK